MEHWPGDVQTLYVIKMLEDKEEYVGIKRWIKRFPFPYVCWFCLISQPGNTVVCPPPISALLNLHGMLCIHNNCLRNNSLKQYIVAVVKSLLWLCLLKIRLKFGGVHWVCFNSRLLFCIYDIPNFYLTISTLNWIRFFCLFLFQNTGVISHYFFGSQLIKAVIVHFSRDFVLSDSMHIISSHLILRMFQITFLVFFFSSWGSYLFTFFLPLTRNVPIQHSNLPHYLHAVSSQQTWIRLKLSVLYNLWWQKLSPSYAVKHSFGTKLFIYLIVIAQKLVYWLP